MGDDSLDDPFDEDTAVPGGDYVDETVLNFSTKQRVEHIVDHVMEDLIDSDGLDEDAKATTELERAKLDRLVSRAKDKTTELSVPTVEPKTNPLGVAPLEVPASPRLPLAMAAGGTVVVVAVLLYLLLG